MIQRTGGCALFLCVLCLSPPLPVYTSSSQPRYPPCASPLPSGSVIYECNRFQFLLKCWWLGLYEQRWENMPCYFKKQTKTKAANMMIMICRHVFLAEIYIKIWHRVWQECLVVDPGQSAFHNKCSKSSWKKKQQKPKQKTGQTCCVNWHHGMAPTIPLELRKNKTKKKKSDCWHQPSTKRTFDFKFCPKALFQKGVKSCENDIKLTIEDSNLKVMCVVCASPFIQKKLHIYEIYIYIYIYISTYICKYIDRYVYISLAE